ncbi:MAG: glutamine-hydrolyzing carbamoyl-phosphate synthase small subunit [Clostridia bacterium]|nr:glutamine-hydrolyzing carbamoyl-phosphate synthase small subunit [Clostridia bacterium]MBQ9925995.1 glutamine-hydrolyzing carbamoyl-phosphate synthase small subunit [Clostridia bacterium]
MQEEVRVNYNKKLVFENGREFLGFGFGADVETVQEVVFDTSVVGYQEIMSDPSYCGQIVCMTYPLIGNYGLADEDYEAKTSKIGGFIVRDYNDSPSNFRYTKTLAQELEENGIPGISGVDTRAITRMLRDEGSMRAIICDVKVSAEEAQERISAVSIPHDHVERVSSKKVWYSRTPNYKYNVVAIDCGIKHNIVRSLNEIGCNVTIVPHNTSAEKIMGMRPDGILVSNGPGDPEDIPEVIALVAELQGKVPMFGIDLGCQLIALANGALIEKLKVGHRGCNHPIKNLQNGKIEIALQNHAHAIVKDSLKDAGLELTHINMLDGTVEGIKNDEKMVFAVQHHPGSVSGSRGVSYLFETFVENMKTFKTKRGAENA